MQPVTISVNDNQCTLSNGILSMTWKEDATLGSISRNGREFVRNWPDCTDTDGKPAFYVDYHAEGAFHVCMDPRLRVIEASDQKAHIAYIDTSGYLAIEFHIILMQGESGYYSYVISSNNTDASFNVDEFRIVYRCGSRIFDHAYNSERHGLQPRHAYMEQFEKIQDETYRLPDGKKYSNGDVYSKYDYAGYFSENPVWGQYGHGCGFFVIPGSTEYYPGGPQKQELLVHYDGIVLNYFTGAHFGTGSMHVPMGWRKFYGPVYQYFNEAEDPEALIRDAQRVAEEKRAQWPYQWVDEPLYPLIRSQVTGRLLFENGMPCRNTTVVLGQKGIPVELQSAGYLFDTKTDSQGYFVLPHVRFGTYSLFAWQTGGSNTDQLEIDGLEITEIRQQLAPVIWKLPSERVIWQLGKATRTCEGYCFAGEPRNYKWMQRVPETLHFYIGQSNEAKDWYYAQTREGSWYIHFQLEEVPASKCRLIVALAAASRGDTESRKLPILTISLNESLLKEAVMVNDGAIYRSSTTNGRYRNLEMTVDPALLHKGENIVELAVARGMVMYDTVLLKAGMNGL